MHFKYLNPLKFYNVNPLKFLKCKQLVSHVLKKLSKVMQAKRRMHLFLGTLPPKKKLYFEFKQFQSPLVFNFDMTINKMQRQSSVSPCFSDDQLYAGHSRIASPNNFFILAPNRRSTKFMYPKALSSEGTASFKHHIFWTATF